MASYLDTHGLGTLWSKIKNYVDSKSGGVAYVHATIEDDVYNIVRFDKSFDEISDLIDSGIDVKCIFLADDGNYELPLVLDDRDNNNLLTWNAVMITDDGTGVPMDKSIMVLFYGGGQPIGQYALLEDGLEVSYNKITSITSSSTDFQYPSAKAVYDEITPVKASLQYADHRNLLDNPWFTVNQRGQTSYSGGYGMCVNRWARSYNSTSVGNVVEVSENGLSGTKGSGNSYISIEQKLEPNVFDTLVGKTCTVSISLNGEIYSQTFTFTTEGVDKNLRSNPRIQLVTTNAKKDIRIRFYSDFTNFRAAKLELGSISTLVNDIAPDYAEELIRCSTSKADPTDTFANQSYNPFQSNRNLLDNPFLTINQRNATQFNAAGSYGVDRWYQSGSGTVVINSDHTITFNNQVWVIQRMYFVGSLEGLTLTASIMFSDGSVMSGTGVIGSKTRTTLLVNNVVTLAVDTTSTYGNAFLALVASGKTVKAFKLEVGTISTLANDVMPPEGPELAKCQRTYWRIGGNGIAVMMMAAYSATDQYGVIQLPTTMRKTPVVATSATSTFTLLGGGTSRAITNLSVQLQNPQTAEIHTKASGLAANAACWLRTTSSGGYIEFRAED